MNIFAKLIIYNFIFYIHLFTFKEMYSINLKRHKGKLIFDTVSHVSDAGLDLIV